MSNKHRNIIAEQQWREAADAFELGHKHAVEIACELGISSATVSREFKRRGCRKASRVAESVAELVAALDAKDLKEARRQEAKDAVAAARGTAIDKLIGEMVRSLIAAERTGNLSSAAPEVAKAGKALNVKPLR